MDQRIRVYLSDRPNYEYAMKHPEFGQHPKGDWSWHRNFPNSSNPLPMAELDDVWKYYLLDHDGQFSRCIYASCKMCIVSCAPEILKIHLRQEHLPATEHFNLVELRREFKKQKYWAIHEQALEDLQKEEIEANKPPTTQKKKLPKNVENFLRLQRLSYEQSLELLTAVKANLKAYLQKFNSFSLFVKICKSPGNTAVIFISLATFSACKFELAHLDVVFIDVSSKDLPSQVEVEVMKILSDFEVNIEKINMTIVEGPPNLECLISQLTLKNVRISYRQKLTQLLSLLDSIETTNRQKVDKIRKIKQLANDEVNSTCNSLCAIDCILSFIEKLQQESKNEPRILKAVYDVFGFVVDPKSTNFCSDYTISTFLNPKLAIDLSDSKTAEALIKIKHPQFDRDAKAIEELSTWKTELHNAAFLGLTALLSKNSKLTEDDFNPARFWVEKRQKYPNLFKIASELFIVPAFIFHQKSAVDGWPEGLNQIDCIVDKLENLKLQSIVAFNEKFWPDF